MNILNIVQNRIYIRNIRAIIQSVRTPKSGVFGLIPEVFPGMFQIRSIRAYTRSLRVYLNSSQPYVLMVNGGACGARSNGEKAGERGGEGGGAHHKPICAVDLGGGGPEERIDAKGRSSSSAPMAVGGRAVDSARKELE